MKKVILLLVFLPCPAFGQLSDDFESGRLQNWTEGSSLRWRSDTHESISGAWSLHHVFDNPANGSDCIGLRIDTLHPAGAAVKWSFKVRHGYDPSSSNNWAVWLLSSAGPETLQNGILPEGFAAGVNLTGYDDTLRIWKIKNGKISVVLTCPLNWQNNIGTAYPAMLTIGRSTGGQWSVEVTDHSALNVFTASGSDPDIFPCNWFLINYRYSSTRDRLLWFDDLHIDGLFYADTVAPLVTGYSVTGRNSLILTLSEALPEGSVSPDDLLLNGSSVAETVNKITELKYRITFRDAFKNKTENCLLIRQLCDNAGNCAVNTSVCFTPVWAGPADVIISEIMADPFPPVSLPGREYLELFNRTTFPVDLRKWSLLVDDQHYIMPSVTIEPQSYLILCQATDTATFSKFGRAAGMKSFPVLADNGRMLVLSDSLANLIHGVEYSPRWYGSTLKSDGGWSLEMIDTGFPFFAEGNWEASSASAGGSPGRVNSSGRSNPDNYFYGLDNVFAVDSQTIRITLSEPLVSFNEVWQSIMIDDMKIRNIAPEDPLLRNFIVSPVVPLVRNKTFLLHAGDAVKDFAGNRMQRPDLNFGLTEPAEKQDIVFNEILFNPLPDDPDYLEFYNDSESIIDASGLYLASVNRAGDTSSLRQVSDTRRCIIPGSFYAISTDREKIISRYFGSGRDNIFEVSSLPSMPDDKGHLLLFDRKLDLIDELKYDEDMHFSLLSGNEGISLEKIRPGISSNDPASWHSASESSGWGTPGAINSVYIAVPHERDIISLSGKRISPDNDGYEDMLVIDFSLSGTGNIISVTVFDETGGFVRKIAENYLAGPGASFVWDGTAADGALVRSGIYIILSQLFDDKGKTHTWKKACAVVNFRR